LFNRVLLCFLSLCSFPGLSLCSGTGIKGAVDWFVANYETARK
jgi:hypothetical protein